ncbi:MAG: hypothetical protein WA830_05995, partial [Candidatus Sulfotelmatobacter sp.]
MLPRNSDSGHRFIPSDVTPETASRTRRRDPVLPKTAADAMPELSVVIVASDDEQRRVLKALVNGIGVARTVNSFATYPVAASDPIMHGVRTANPVVTLVDIPADNPPLALRAIELLHQEMPDAAIFAIGNLNKPQVIVDAMRAGAREFIGRPTTRDDLLEAFGRLTTSQQRRVQKRRVPRLLAGEIQSLKKLDPALDLPPHKRAVLSQGLQKIQAAPIEGKVWWIDGKLFWGTGESGKAYDSLSHANARAPSWKLR